MIGKGRIDVLNANTRESESNPYSAPRTGPDIGVLTDFYRTDSRRFSYAEYWRLSPNPLGFVVAAIFKTIRVPLPGKFALGYPHELTLVAWEDVEPHVMEKWSARLKQCEEAGYRRVFCHRLTCRGVTRETLSCFLLSDDRLSTVTLNYVRAENSVVLKEVVTTALASRLQDGRLALTFDYWGYLDPKPDEVVRRVSGKPIQETLERHRDWIAGLGAIPVPLDPNDLPQLVLKREQQSIEYRAARGLLVRLSAHELARIERQGTRETAPKVFNSPFFRLLQGTQRVLFIVMFVTAVSTWVDLGIAAPMRRGLIQLLLMLGCFAGLALVNIVKLALRQSDRSVT